MADSTPTSSDFVNCRAHAQWRAFKTYYESQEPIAASADANEPSVEAQRRTDGSIPGQGKRARESGSPEVARKVKRTLGADDIRLTQTNARNPKDTYKILVPTTNYGVHDNDWNPDHRQNMGGTKRGIQPGNSLGKPTPQSQPAKGKSFWAPHVTNSLPTMKSAGANVRKASDAAAFEIYQASERSAKKQKLSSGKPVDLTSEADADEIFTVIPHPKSHGELGSARSKRLASLDDSFAMTESAKADSYTIAKTSKSKKRRKDQQRNSGSQRSSARSAQSPPIEVFDDSSENRMGSRYSPLVITGDGDEQRKSHDTAASRRPPIRLEDGLAEITAGPQRAAAKISRGSAQDLQNANNLLSPTIRHTNKPPPKFPKRVQPDDSAEHESGKLRTKFKRDHGTPGDQIKAKHRMQAESGKVMRDGSSPDQLQGGITVPSHSSPVKVSNKLSQSSVQPNGTQRQLSVSVDAVRQPGSCVASSPYNSNYTSPDEEEAPGELRRIPIRSIFSKQCVQQQNFLALVWDEESERFHVACGEDFVRLPHRDALVSIGKSDVGTSWTHNRTVAKAMLKGSSTDISNGTIIIEFENEEGLNACHDQLMHAAGDRLKTTTVTPQYMNQIFDQQLRSLCTAHGKLSQTGPPVIGVMGSRRAGNEGARGSDEDIRYDDGSSTPGEARSHKQNARLYGEPSPYFSQEPPRRSNRQVKQVVVRPRSPTPPRWSREHDPVKWLHPVVYPSQGARRVTVYDSDIARLDEGEFLNDNLLGFAIRHIEENMDPTHKQKVHFFNTFFYSSLMKNKRTLDYDAVKRWTKNTDIFTVPYTVVPINNDLHWYFAIICNLQFLDRKLSADDDDEDEDQAHADVQDSSPRIIDIDDGAEEETRSQSTRDVFVFDDDGNIAQAEDAPASSRPSTADGKKSKKLKQKAPTKKYDTRAPVIIMLDSLGHVRTAESTALKKYIQAEAKEKRAMDVDLKQIQGLNAKGLPSQPNFCDCGVFVIGYLNEFAKDPDAFVKKLLHREMDPEKDLKDFSAPNTRNSVRETLFEIADEQAKEYKLQKSLKAQKKAKSVQNSSPAKPSQQATPVPEQLAAQEPSTATLRATSAPALPLAKSRQASPAFTTSQTARSSPGYATARKLVDEDEDEDENELVVSPPVALLRSGCVVSARSSSPTEDEEMLGVVNATIPPNPYSNMSTAFTTKKASPASSDQDVKTEIADSQEIAVRF